MSEIIRLQGLPPVADSFDIRQFFYGLTIPRGGVYITGGKYGEAFIIFSNFQDARYAMTLSGRPLKSSFIYLSYSTEPEMRRALEVYRIGPTDPLGAGLRQPDRGTVSRFSENPSYLFLQGMPQKVTKVELREYFGAFRVDDVLFLKFINGVRNGNAIVKFNKPTDASDALKLDGVFLCGSPVILRVATEAEWKESGGDSRAPSRRERTPPPRRRRTRSRSPIRRRERNRSPYIREFYVHLINVSYRAEKKDLKSFFFDLDMDDNHITFLLDKDGKRTREAFAMFTTQKDYKRALKLHLETFKDHTINILPISKRGMQDLIDRMKKRSTKESSSSSSKKTCLYLRNFKADVSKSDIVSFFGEISVKEDDITLLSDDKGVGLGEALVKFPDEDAARKADKLNHNKHESTEILVSRITNEQMRNFLKGPSKKNPDGKATDKDSSKVDESVVSQADEPSEGAKEPENVAGSDKAPSSAKAEEMDSAEGADDITEMDVTPPLETDPTSDAAEPSLQNNGPEQNESDDEDPDEPKGKAETNGNCEDSSKGLTQLFIRNLPVTITAAEILDFFHGYKVKSVNLKEIASGVASVQMPDKSEASSAIEALSKKEIGSKQVLLSLE